MKPSQTPAGEPAGALNASERPCRHQNGIRMMPTDEPRAENVIGELLRLASDLSRIANEALESAIRLNFPATDIATIRDVMERFGEDIERLRSRLGGRRAGKVIRPPFRKLDIVMAASEVAEATTSFLDAVRRFQGVLQAAQIVRKPMETAIADSSRQSLETLGALATAWRTALRLHEKSLAKAERFQLELQIQRSRSASARFRLVEEIDRRRAEVTERA